MTYSLAVLVLGSFTGVRIGVSTIKAFNDVTNIPIASVSSLEGLAYNTLNEHSEYVLSIIDAKNDNVYYGLFQKKNEKFFEVQPLGTKNINGMIEMLKKYANSKILFVGDGTIVHKNKLLQNFKKADFIDAKHNIQTSASIGKAGFEHYKEGIYGDSNSLIPLYLRKSQAERALEGEK